MKHVLIFTGLTYTVLQVTASTLLAQEVKAPAAAKPNAPRIEFSEMTFNFGKVQPSSNLIHEFIVTNTGSAMLEITAVQPGCGCTTAGSWDKQIEPGKTGKIPIQFNPANFFGTVSKGVTVTCNDPAQGTHHLQIQATIWRALEVQPQYVHFMPVEGEATNETKVVRILNNLEEPITLEEPKSSTPSFTTELKTIRPGKEFELHITYAGAVSNGAPNGNVSVNSTAAGSQPLNVSVFAMPQPALSIIPQFVQLPAGPYSPGYQYPVTIRNNSRTPLKLTEPSVSASGVTAQIQELEPGKNFRINLGIPADFHAPAGQPVELSLKTTHPKYPQLKIPITQVGPPPVVGPVLPAVAPK